MTSKSKKKILNRMSYLIGHLEGVAKMIEDDKYCIDIIKQNQAVIAAIEKVNEKILRKHLETCVTQVVGGKKKTGRRKVFDEIIEIFKESK